MNESPLTNELGILCSFLIETTEKNSLWIVGGVVRDILAGLGLRDADIDFVYENLDEDFFEKLRSQIGGSELIHEKFLTRKLVEIPCFETLRELDFVRARREDYLAPGVLPKVFPGNLSEDLARRDFSINALAVEISDFVNWIESGDDKMLASKVIDLGTGVADLQQRKIRILHEFSFRDDPTRLFRACRYKVRIGGAFEATTARAFSKAIDQGALETISRQRCFTELRKAMREVSAGRILQSFKDEKVLAIFSEISGSLWSDGITLLKERELLFPHLCPALREKVGLRVLLQIWPEEQREQLRSDLQLSKKRFARYLHEDELAEQGRWTELSDLGVLVGLLSHPSESLRTKYQAFVGSEGQ